MKRTRSALALLLALALCAALLSGAALAASGAWRHNSTGWWYQNSDGSYPAGQWQRIDGTWYYFDSRGYMKTGWLYDGGAWYYLKPSGAMAVGWQKVDGTWYYLSGSGAMKTGWLYDGGAWYYLKPSGAMAVGWQKVGGTWYYLSGSGAMKTGWLYDGGAWYYLDTSGAMRTGWLSYGGSWYYLNGTGAMVTGTHSIDGQTYTFGSDGRMIDSADTELSACLTAYADVLRAVMQESASSSYAQPRFALACIDGDELPELLIADGSWHGASVRVYTWQAGTLIDLDYYGSFGTLYFARGAGMIREDNFFNGIGPNTHFHYLSDGDAQELIWFLEDNRNVMYYGGDPVYSINEETVSAYYYDAQLSAWLDAYYWTEFSYEIAFSISSSAISGMLADYTWYLL